MQNEQDGAGKFEGLEIKSAIQKRVVGGLIIIYPNIIKNSNLLQVCDFTGWTWWALSEDSTARYA